MQRCQLYLPVVWVQMQCVELLLLLGQIHQAAGTPLTALPYVLSCLLHSTDLHMDLLVCYITAMPLAASLLSSVWVLLHVTCRLLHSESSETERPGKSHLELPAIVDTCCIRAVLPGHSSQWNCNMTYVFATAAGCVGVCVCVHCSSHAAVLCMVCQVNMTQRAHNAVEDTCLTSKHTALPMNAD